MSLSHNMRAALAAGVLAGSGYPAAEAALVNFGGEYRIVESLPGDQVRSHMSFGADGGFLVTQDNYVDGRSEEHTSELQSR